jgi:hypothetical protein
MWQVFAAAAVNGWLGNQVGKAQAQIDTRLSAVNATASNQVRRAKNTETAAHNGLARYVQSVNNNRLLDDGGDAYTANLVSGWKFLDSATNQSFLNDVRNMEEVGAAVASQAAVGAGGQVTDMINSTTALRASISKELAQQSVDSARYDITARSQSIMSQMVGGMDGSLIIDQLDESKSVAQKTYAPSNGQAIFNSILQTALKTGMGNVAEWGAQQLGSLGSGPAGNGFTAGGWSLGTTERAMTSSKGTNQFSFNKVKFGGI